jgi:hypothetical protein
MKRSTTRGRDGDYLVVDDRSGFTRWRSHCVRQWNGLIVHRSIYDSRHPQDYLRARREDFRLPDARPEGRIEDQVFVGPLVTEIAADVPGFDDMYAPMGPLGVFAVGQTDDGGVEIESNLAGADSITVASVRRMNVGDRIGIVLDSGDLFSTEIEYIIGAATLQIAGTLPGSTSAGNRVFDYTAAVSGTLG